MSAASVSADLPSMATSEKDEEFSDDAQMSSPSSRAESAPVELRQSVPVAVGDEMVLGTLLEVDHICSQLRDVEPPTVIAANVDLVEAISRPSTIAARSEVKLRRICLTIE